VTRTLRAVFATDTKHRKWRLSYADTAATRRYSLSFARTRSLRLVEPLQRAVVALVQAPVADHWQPLQVQFPQHAPAGGGARTSRAQGVVGSWCVVVQRAAAQCDSQRTLNGQLPASGLRIARVRVQKPRLCRCLQAPQLQPQGGQRGRATEAGSGQPTHQHVRIARRSTEVYAMSKS